MLQVQIMAFPARSPARRSWLLMRRRHHHHHHHGSCRKSRVSIRPRNRGAWRRSSGRGRGRRGWKRPSAPSRDPRCAQRQGRIEEKGHASGPVSHAPALLAAGAVRPDARVAVVVRAVAPVAALVALVVVVEARGRPRVAVAAAGRPGVGLGARVADHGGQLSPPGVDEPVGDLI